MATKLNQLRQKYIQEAKKTIEASEKTNLLEFLPPIGKTNVRFLPAINDDELFYCTHSYHYLPLRGGMYLYTPHKFIVNGVEKEDPIDVAVRQFYSLATKNNDEEIRRHASTLKRKRHYYFHILLIDEPSENKYRILIDRSNKGKLARIICVTMGIPFFRDTQTRWVDRSSLNIDEDKTYYDLIDIEEGHDFRIVAAKIGNEPWDVTYTDSFPHNTARPLSKEERKCLDQRVDLKNYVKYETDYHKVEALLNEYIESLSAQPIVEDEKEVDGPLPSLNKDQRDEMKRATKNVSKVEDIDKLLSELD